MSKTTEQERARQRTFQKVRRARLLEQDAEALRAKDREKSRQYRERKARKRELKNKPINLEGLFTIPPRQRYKRVR